MLRREDGHVLRRALDFEVESSWKMEGQGRCGKSRLRNKGWFEKERCTLPFNVECWRKQEICWVEVNLATLIYLGYYQILNIGLSQ